MRTKLLVNVLARAEDDVLLVRYGTMPDGQMGWMMPSVIVEAGGSVRDAIGQALHDQLNLDASRRYTIGDVDSFVGHDGTWHVSVSVVVDVAKKDVQTAADIVEAEWLPLKTMAKVRLAHGGWTKSVIDRACSR